MMRRLRMSHTTDAQQPTDGGRSRLSAWRRQVYDLRTEGGGPGRETAAIACGVFIGCLPFYGFHLLICWIVGWAFRLNRLKLYLAANISNPFIAPFLLFAELQTGAYLRRGTFHTLTLDAVRQTGAVALGSISSWAAWFWAASSRRWQRWAPTPRSAGVHATMRSSTWCAGRPIGTSA